MKTLSVKQPWAFLLCAGIKDIENRTWKTNYRGRVFIHASGQSWIWSKVINYLTPKMKEVFENNKCTGTWLRNLQKGAIIGSVEIVDCVINHPSIWAEKTDGVLVGNKFFTKEETKPVYNWVIANPILFANPWLNIKGKLGLWEFENMKGIYDTTRVKNNQ